MKILYLILIFIINSCATNGGKINMNSQSLPANVLKSKEIILNYKNQQESVFKNAITIINNFEKPEYLERIVLNEDGSRSFCQNYYYNKVGIEIYKKDNTIIGVKVK